MPTLGRAARVVVEPSATWADEDVRLHHYQRDREDVDLVLENRRGENDGLNWPHCDGLNWPHLRPIVA